MKKLPYFALIFMFFGCTTKIQEDDIKQLNGYWEIEKVTFADGETKAFTVNPTIDYIKLEGLEGFHKKVYPKFDGTFKTSDDAEYFVVKKRENAFQLLYNVKKNTDPSLQRTESLIQLSSESFSIINSDSLTYTYKRFQPINVTE